MEQAEVGSAAQVMPQSTPLPMMFYVVSTRKFTILFLSTLGLYLIYWFYKNWDRYKDRVPAASLFGTAVSPVVRAVFCGFFVHTLFNRIKAHCSNHTACQSWATALHAWWAALLLLSGECLGILVKGFLGRPYGAVVTLVVLILTLFAFLKVQRMINLACDDPAGTGNAQLSCANFIWIALGVVGWIATVWHVVNSLQ